MKYILTLIFILNISSFCQQNNGRITFNRYDVRDISFIEEIKSFHKIDIEKWIRYISTTDNITFYYPPEFSIEKTFNASFCDSIISVGSYKDSLFFDYVHIMLFNGDYPDVLNYSVFQESKVHALFTRDSIGTVTDSGKTYWITYGHQGTENIANIIKGGEWIGLEGSESRRVYSDVYLGLTYKTDIFLFYKRKGKCGIIIEYTDRPYFYDEEKDNSENEPEYFLDEDIFYLMAELISQNN